MKQVVVHLDAGHAKSTPGKRMVKDGIEFYEYQFNREVVNRIVNKLQVCGIEVNIVTPEEETDVPLTERANRVNNFIKANPNKSHLFISVHGNACGNGSSWMSGEGWECYTTVGKTNSDKFAECLYENANKVFPPLGIKVRTDKSDGDSDKESNFTVIYKTNCPAILTENLFYDNKSDVKFMMSEDGQNKIADIHVNGVKAYIEKYLK